MNADEIYARYCALRRCQVPVDPTATDALVASQVVRADMDRLAAALAAAPGAHDRFLLWMVDFGGHDSIEWTPDDVERVRATGSAHRLVLEHLGGLGINVARWLKLFCSANPEHAKFTDSGGGASGWHMGIHCSAPAAWALARQGQAAFGAAISSGLLRIDIKPWSPYVA